MQGYPTTGLRTRLTPIVLAILGAILAGGCGTLRPFNNRLGAAYTAVQTSRQAALHLLREREITPEQAQVVQDRADQLRGSLDLASSIRASDPGRAGGILSRVLSAVAEVERCTSVERPRLSECVERVEVPR